VNAPVARRGQPAGEETARAERVRHFREDQVRESVKMEALADLATGIANDFNNALAAISASVELAWMHLPPSEEAALQELTVAREASRRAARLVRRLFQCARPAPSVRRPVDPRHVVLNAAASLRRELEACYDVETRFGHGDWRVSADAEQLTDILLNLGYNARDAMPGGGRITITTARAGSDEDVGVPPEVVQGREFIRIDVTDRGTGVAPEILPRIFEPFFTTKETGHGAGLGLATVYSVLRQHEGGITVESALGEGSTFSLFLPRHQDAPALAIVPATQPRRRDLGSVLVVDNEVDIRVLTREVLEQAGLTVLDAADGAEGLAVLERSEGAVRLAIVDVVMPRMSGWQVLAEIRRRWPDVAVVMTSGFAPDDLPVGGDVPELFLTKPFALSTLVREARRLLESKG
jgi:two-component system cell cycle sensor histidine kinase/response regulator CckA